MRSVAWRTGLTIALLVAVVLAGTRTGQTESVRGAAQAQVTGTLSVADDCPVELALSGDDECAYDWAVLDVDRHPGIRIAHVPR